MKPVDQLVWIVRTPTEAVSFYVTQGVARDRLTKSDELWSARLLDWNRQPAVRPTSQMLTDAADALSSAVMDYPSDDGWQSVNELRKLADQFRQRGD